MMDASIPAASAAAVAASMAAAAAGGAPCPQCGSTLPADAPEGLCPRCLVGLNLGGPPHDLANDPADTAPHPASLSPIPTPAEIARHFPHLEILECLGRGGMGVVYKARQPRLGRLVALKILAPGRERDPQFAERFTREAQALARLAHPAIVAIHDFGQADGLFYLLMEYVEGRSLRSMLREGRPKPGEALGLVPELCDALQFAHRNGVVHRDIKPENILVDSHGHPKIADFGIAKLLGSAGTAEPLTEARGIVGTPHYMAPEQVERPTEVDHRADIYSLGVVFYELLTGELPLGKFPPPSERASIDPRLDPVVLRSLEKEPRRRYQQADHLKADVESVRTEASAANPKPAVMPVSDATASLPDATHPPSPTDPRPAASAPRSVPVAAVAIQVLAGIQLLLIALVCALGIVLVALEHRGFDLDGLFTDIANALVERDPSGLKTWVVFGVGLLISGNLLALRGADRMRRFASYRFALCASALIMALPPGFVLGFPLGLASLVLLGRRDTQAAFRQRWLATSSPTQPRSFRALGGTLLATVVGPGLVLLAVQGWMESTPSSSRARAADLEASSRKLQAIARAHAEARAAASPGNRPTAVDGVPRAHAAQAVPPVVVEALPVPGSTDVDPNLREIRVRFSKPMTDGGWSWCIWTEETRPEITGAPRFLEDRRTCVLPVRLQPGRSYAIWVNDATNHNFRDGTGLEAVPYLLTFRTRPAP